MSAKVSALQTTTGTTCEQACVSGKARALACVCVVCTCIRCGTHTLNTTFGAPADEPQLCSCRRLCMHTRGDADTMRHICMCIYAHACMVCVCFVRGRVCAVCVLDSRPHEIFSTLGAPFQDVTSYHTHTHTHTHHTLHFVVRGV